MEGFILKLTTIDAEALLWVLLHLNLATLQVHSLHYPVHLSIDIRQQLSIVTTEVLTQRNEVVTSLGCNVLEELKHHGLVHSSKVEVHVGILASLGVVDHLAVSIGSHLVVDDGVRVVHVAERVEGPVGKGIAVAHVLLVVQVDDVRARVLVEDALESEGSLLEEFLPLGLEELETFGCDEAWMLPLQESCSGHTFLE